MPTIIMPTINELEEERRQLLNHWEGIKYSRIIELTANVIENIDKDVGQSIRSLHNYLGYNAKNQKGGFCRGCIYRTRKFIKTPPEGRTGEKKNNRQNIHVEHTVPIATLSEKIRLLHRDGASTEIIARFLIQHSVTTGTHIDEKGDNRLVRRGFERTTNALNADENEYLKPFSRYQSNTPVDNEGNHAFEYSVFNVLTGEEINFQDFSFENHRNILNALITTSASATLDLITDNMNGLNA